ncbi:MAG: SpoIIE family protein phosphatase [Acidobacteria bacterium]|nr:SpoIIE family protein phosphatase [Acidobacteriota bacterium]
MAQLRVHRGADGVPDRVLGASTLIGRSRTADLHLPDRGVSSRHALVRVTDAGTFVIDLGSQNGTFVNQRRVETPVRLHPGDMLRVGDVLLEFDAAVPEAPGPATVSVPVAARSETQVLVAVPARGRTAPSGSVLDELRRRLMESFDGATLLPFVAERLLEALPGAERVFVMRGAEADAMVLAAASVRSGSDEIAASRTLLRRAIEQREGLIYSDVRTEGALAEAASVRVTAVRAVMCVPLTFDERVLGVIQADTTASVATFGEGDLRMLMAVAAQVAATLAYAALHETRLAEGLLAHDLALARRLQEQFLPELPPASDGVACAAAFVPALAVGGDFYDVLPLGGGRLAVAIGDVSGKGIAAAIYAAAVLTEWRGVIRADADPAAVLRELNLRLSRRNPEGMFVTIALLIVDGAAGTIDIATAGHPLPLLRNAAGRVRAAGERGAPPLGIDPDAAFTTHRVPFAVGDTVLLLTDGVTEARSDAGELFGFDRATAAFATAGHPPESVVERVLGAVRAFVRGQAFGDDATLVALSRL